MKVFVYLKGRPTKKIATLNNIIAVREEKDTNQIIFERKHQGISFDTKRVKCTIYQN